MSRDDHILIERRFCGPPGSGNGGYVCGRLAQYIDGTAAVRLRAPPPLDKRMEVRPSESGIALFDGDVLVAEARPAAGSLEPPEPPSYHEAEVASRHYRGCAFPEPAQGAILLGELQVKILGGVSPGERCVLVAWELAHEGRKHHTGSALFGESGSCRGVGVGTWFEVARKPDQGAP